MSNELTGAKVLAKMLHDYGVTDIFHVPAVLRTTMAELETISNIRRIHAHGGKLQLPIWQMGMPVHLGDLVYVRHR